MAKKKKDLKRNDHRRKERRERREQRLAIREAMRELGDLLQHSAHDTARPERQASRSV